MIAAGLALALALGGPMDGLSELARGVYRRGQAYEAQGEWSRAAAAYRMVWTQEPGWTQALLDEARVLAAEGRVEEALRALRKGGVDPDVLEARGHLLLESGRSEEAAEVFQRLAQAHPEDPSAYLWLAEARIAEDPGAAERALGIYLDAPSLQGPGALDEEGVVRVASALVLALDAAGRQDDAYALAGRVLERVGDDLPLEGLLSKRREGQVAALAEELKHAAAVPLSPRGVSTLREARGALFAGDVDGARATLRALTEAEPRAVAAWMDLSVAEERAGDIGAAVAAARRAEALDPFDAHTSGRLGDLLAGHYGGRKDVEAAEVYTKAVQRRGVDARLWWRKAELEGRTGRRSASLASYRRVMALAPGTELVRRAEAAVAELTRPLPPPPAPDAVRGEGYRPANIPAEAWDALHLAWAWQHRAEAEPDALDHAQAELDRALRLAPDWPRAINLDGAIRLDRGDDLGALQRYRRSLELDPRQGGVWLVVGALLSQQGDDEGAAEAVRRAAALGEPEALLAEAEGALQRWRLWEASALLRRYRERSVEAPERVAELERGVRWRVAGLAGVGALGGFAVVGVPLWRWRRRRAGVGLDAVLARDARAFPEVARILAAIRHEVIKHHTTVLDAVAEALEAGDEGPATWAEERLFGGGGAVPTFYGHLAELGALAERQGLRLNLRHADPELASVVRAMDALAATEGRLARQDPDHLRALARALNGEGYRALGRRVRSLCQQTVDEGLVREAWSLACRELGDGTPFEVSVEAAGGPLVVRMFRQDLLDVLVNLLRNAVQANEATGGGRVGVVVGVEDDWVTGLERVVIQIRDESRLRLDTEQLRGRFLGRGLGLAVDRVTQAGGSIHVEEVTGWAKAVTVRLPRLEVGRDDEGDDGSPLGEPTLGLPRRGR